MHKADEDRFAAGLNGTDISSKDLTRGGENTLSLPLSVIICTYNRAELFGGALEGLLAQTLGRDKFEVIVIDDGSSDGTVEVAASFSVRLPIRYFRQKNAGLASARNHGIYASRGRILFFCDDDDVAAPTLLEEHLGTHGQYQQPDFAVLNYTGWSPALSVTPLMNFITEVGCFLFSYPHIKHGDILDYSFFWGGRVSCKRDFLIEHGVFNPEFRFGCEDIELGYRLSKAGLKVVFNKNAVSFMSRPVTFDDFCKRLVKQGRSQYIFSAMHADPAVQRWTEVREAEKWSEIEAGFDAMKKSTMDLDTAVNIKLKQNLGVDSRVWQQLHAAYWWVFRACKMKGIAESRQEREDVSLQAAEAGFDSGPGGL